MKKKRSEAGKVFGKILAGALAGMMLFGMCASLVFSLL